MADVTQEERERAAQHELPEPDAAREWLRVDDAHPPLRGARGRDVREGEGRRLPAPRDRRGGDDRRRRPRDARRGLPDLHLPLARPRARRAARTPSKVMAELFGREDGVSQRPRRLDAHVRPRAPLHGRLRDRRRQPPARRRAWRCPPTTAGPRRSRSACSATAPPTRARSARRSTSPRCGSCRSSSWSPTTSSAWARRSSATPRVTDLHRRGEGFGVPGHALRRHGRASTPTTVIGEALEQAREERQPVLVEAITYRFRGHSMADPEEYRTKEQVAEWRKRDPIETFARAARARRASSRTARPRRSTRRSVKSIDEAVAFADKSPLPAARVALRRHLRARRPGQAAGTRSTSAPPACTAARTSASSPTRSAARPTPTARRSSRRRARTSGSRRRRRGAGRGRRRRGGGRTDGRRPLPRGAQPGAARGDAARRERLPHGRGHRRLQRRVQGHAAGCSRSSARSACATRRSPRTRSSAWASAPR